MWSVSSNYFADNVHFIGHGECADRVQNFCLVVLRTTVPIPVLASTSLLQSTAVGGSVVGVVGPL